jgi:hypothetical protein
MHFSKLPQYKNPELLLNNDIAATTFYAVEGGSKFLRNVSTNPSDFTQFYLPKDNKCNIRRWQYIQSDITSDVRRISRLEN